MLEAVLIFGVLSAVFEAIVIKRMCPRWLLQSSAGGLFIHTMVISINLFIHYGTVTGTMTAIVAGIASFMVVPMMRKVHAK